MKNLLVVLLVVVVTQSAIISRPLPLGSAAAKRYEIVGSSPHSDSKISVSRRDVVSKIARERCERCRNNPLCKVRKMCGICEKICENVETTTLPSMITDSLDNVVPPILPGANNFGLPYRESENLELKEEQTSSPTVLSSRSAMPEPESSRNVGRRFFTVGQIFSGPSKNLIGRLFDVRELEKVEKFIIVAQWKSPEKSKDLFDTPVIVDLLNAFGSNGTSPEIHQLSPPTTERRMDLADEVNLKLDKAIKDKKKELNTSHLTREQISTMIDSIMAEINRRNNGTTLQLPEPTPSKIGCTQEGLGGFFERTNNPEINPSVNQENFGKVGGIADDWVDDNEEARNSTPLPDDHPNVKPPNEIGVLGETLNVSGETKPKPESDNQFNIQSRRNMDFDEDNTKQLVSRAGEESEDLAKDIMKIVEDSFRMPLNAENIRNSQNQNVDEESTRMANGANRIKGVSGLVSDFADNTDEEQRKLQNQMVVQKPSNQYDDQNESTSSFEDDSTSSEDSNHIPQFPQQKIKLPTSPQTSKQPIAATKLPSRTSAANQENKVLSFKLPQNPSEKLLTQTAEGPIKKPKVIEISKGDDPIKIMHMLEVLREMGKIENASSEVQERSKLFPSDTPVLWSDLPFEELYNATQNLESRMSLVGNAAPIEEAENLETGEGRLGEARARVFPYHRAREFDPNWLPKGPLSPEELAINAPQPNSDGLPTGSLPEDATITPNLKSSTITSGVEGREARGRVFPYHRAREFDPNWLPKGPLSPEELAINAPQPNSDGLPTGSLPEDATITPNLKSSTITSGVEGREARGRVFPYHRAREFDPNWLPKGPLSPEELAINAPQPNSDGLPTGSLPEDATITPNLKSSTITSGVEGREARGRVFPYHRAREFDPNWLPKGPLSPEELAINAPQPNSDGLPTGSLPEDATITPNLESSTITSGVEGRQARGRVFPYHRAREFDPNWLPKGPLSPEELAINAPQPNSDGLPTGSLSEDATIPPNHESSTITSGVEGREARGRVFPYHRAREFDPNWLPKGPLSPEELAINAPQPNSDGLPTGSLSEDATIPPNHESSTITSGVEGREARGRVFPYHRAREFDPNWLPKGPLSPEELAINAPQPNSDGLPTGSLPEEAIITPNLETSTITPGVEGREARGRVFPYHRAREFDPNWLPKGPLSAEALAINAPQPTETEITNPGGGSELSEAVGSKQERFNSFGSIIPASDGIIGDNPNTRRVYFIGKDISLPLQVMQDQNGILQLSVDMEKLCNCKNKSCPKKHHNPSKMEQNNEIVDVAFDETQNESFQSPASKELINEESNLPKQIFKRSPTIYDNELVKDYSEVGEKLNKIEKDQDFKSLQKKLDQVNEDVVMYDRKNQNLLVKGTTALLHNVEATENSKKSVNLVSKALALLKKISEEKLKLH